MDRIRTARGELRRSPLPAVPLPIPYDPDPNRGSIVLGDNGRLYASMEINNEWQWVSLSAVSEALSATTIFVYVDWQAEYRTAEELNDIQPTSPDRATADLTQAMLWAEGLPLPSGVEIVYKIAPGLYQWNEEGLEQSNKVTFEAYESDFSAPRFSRYEIATDAQPVNANNDHGFFSLEAAQSGYGDLNLGVHIIPVTFLRPEPTNEYAIGTANYKFSAGVQFTGGIFFTGLDLHIALIKEAIDDPSSFPLHLRSSSGGLLSPWVFSGGEDLGGNQVDVETALSSAFTTNRATNIDTYLNAYRLATSSLYGFSFTQLNGYMAWPYFEVAGGTSRLTDIVFGPCVYHNLWRGISVARSGLIDISGAAVIEALGNIFIFGANTVTTAGSGLTANNPVLTQPHIDASSAAAPFSLRWTAGALINVKSAAAVIEYMGSRVRHAISAIAKKNYYQMPSPGGMLLPNHIVLCDKDGNLGTSLDGPFFSALIVFSGGSTLFPEKGFANRMSDAIATGDSETASYPGTVYTSGIIGACGPNGVSSALTRCILIGGNYNGESGVQFIGNMAAEFPVLGPPISGPGDNPIPAADMSLEDPGTCLPSQQTNITAITTPDPAGLNMGYVTWKLGVDVNQGTIISSTPRTAFTA